MLLKELQHTVLDMPEVSTLREQFRVMMASTITIMHSTVEVSLHATPEVQLLNTHQAAVDKGTPEAPDGSSPKSGGIPTVPAVPFAPKKGKKAIGKATNLKNQQIGHGIPSGDKAQEAAGKGGRSSAQGIKNSQQENPRDCHIPYSHAPVSTTPSPFQILPHLSVASSIGPNTTSGPIFGYHLNHLLCIPPLISSPNILSKSFLKTSSDFLKISVPLRSLPTLLRNTELNSDKGAAHKLKPTFHSELRNQFVSPYLHIYAYSLVQSSLESTGGTGFDRDNPPPEWEVSNPSITEGNDNEKSPPPVVEGAPAKPSEARAEGPSHNSWGPMPPTAEQLMATINQYLQAAGTRWMECSASATPEENHGVNLYAHQAGHIAALRAQFVQATREADASMTDHSDQPAQTVQGARDEGDDLYGQVANKDNTLRAHTPLGMSTAQWGPNDKADSSNEGEDKLTQGTQGGLCTSLAAIVTLCITMMEMTSTVEVEASLAGPTIMLVPEGATGAKILMTEIPLVEDKAVVTTAAVIIWGPLMEAMMEVALPRHLGVAAGAVAPTKAGGQAAPVETTQGIHAFA
ncbi:hypothetical protein BV22DRAFT_1134512 [Leucogyrophana mollusca]|uniref:Uncharacterized protein n=1 Tax=Leucogyrophana mollusca TaxID=85980 RepID=A0ACB8B0A4_9AGAM|nr:hypothetical protein BV22DRAFT_1134512 [Leucogyrophana mollusca]